MNNYFPVQGSVVVACKHTAKNGFIKPMCNGVCVEGSDGGRGGHIQRAHLTVTYNQPSRKTYNQPPRNQALIIQVS